MRTRDWYFQGWERGADGKLRYTGEYYTLPEGRPKAAALGLGGALCALYLLTAFFPSEGGMWRVAAIPQLLELIPLMYLVMGAVCLLRADTSMTFRDWYASWHRMANAAAWSIGIAAAMVLTEIVYLFAAERPDILRELSFLFRELACAVLSFGLYRFIHTHPCTQSVSK